MGMEMRVGAMMAREILVAGEVTGVAVVHVSVLHETDIDHDIS